MAQADRVLSTPPKNAPAASSRHGFLAPAAAVAAGGAAVGMVLSIAGIGWASERPDPIYAAIEAHKVAAAETKAAGARNFGFFAHVPMFRRISGFILWRSKIPGERRPWQ